MPLVVFSDNYHTRHFFEFFYLLFFDFFFGLAGYNALFG